MKSYFIYNIYYCHLFWFWNCLRSSHFLAKFIISPFFLDKIFKAHHVFFLLQPWNQPILQGSRVPFGWKWHFDIKCKWASWLCGISVPRPSQWHSYGSMWICVHIYTHIIICVSLCLHWKSWVHTNISAAARWRQSCPTLCDPVDGNLPGSYVHGIFQARVLEWIAIAFSNQYL